VFALAERLRRELRELDFSVGDSCSQIVPLILGDAQQAVALSRRLEQQGLLVPAIRPPSVPEGSSRLRISLTAAHTEADVMQLVTAMRKCVPLPS
jgi:8-amino-7-oxononanoate synthase